MSATTPAPLLYIANTSAAIALIPTLAGAGFLFNPSRGIAQLGLDGQATEREMGLFQIYACRQCAAGLTTLAIWYAGSYRALGFAGLAGLLLAVTDGFVARRLVGESEGWKHWGSAPIGLGLSGALIYYTS